MGKAWKEPSLPVLFSGWHFGKGTGGVWELSGMSRAGAGGLWVSASTARAVQGAAVQMQQCLQQEE